MYRSVLRSMNRLADLVTGTVQNGSLPVYTGVVLLAAAAFPSWRWCEVPPRARPPAVDRRPGSGGPRRARAGGCAARAASARRRFAAALFLGLAGYSMAGLFVLQGAPDLALSTGGDRDPDHGALRPRAATPARPVRAGVGAIAGRPAHVAIAASVGLMVFVFALR